MFKRNHSTPSKSIYIYHFNREYLAPQIRSMNNGFHSEAKLPWSYDYPLGNRIATKAVFATLPFFRVSSENFPARGVKLLAIVIQ